MLAATRAGPSKGMKKTNTRRQSQPGSVQYSSRKKYFPAGGLDRVSGMTQTLVSARATSGQIISKGSSGMKALHFSFQL
jgi:hypothetical protein